MQTNERGIPVSQAAKILGISVTAARKRVQRGHLRAYKVDGQWMVVVPGDTQLTQDMGMTMSLPHGYDMSQDSVINDLRDRVRFLEGLVNELIRREREAPAVQVDEVPAYVPALPAGAPPSHSPTVAPQSKSGEAVADRVPTPIRPVRRPWWRRWLGR